MVVHQQLHIVLDMVQPAHIPPPGGHALAWCRMLAVPGAAGDFQHFAMGEELCHALGLVGGILGTVMAQQEQSRV
jgi:hypothetical protein